MFSLHDFIMSALQGMARNYPDYQVKEFALGWYTKNVLTETDLATVEEWLIPQVQEEVPEEVPEEVIEEE